MSLLGIILIVLILVWLLGWGAPFSGLGYHGFAGDSGLIHIILVIVIIVVIVRLVRGESIF